MKVQVFDIQEGIYSFEMEGIDTAFHSHPAWEVIFVETGSLKVITPEQQFEDLAFVAIAPNQLHRVVGMDCLLRILMFEYRNDKTLSYLKATDLQCLNDCYYTSVKKDANRIFEELWKSTAYEVRSKYADDRINKCMGVLGNPGLSYDEMMKEVQHVVHLSESRISHLFKEHVGISMKKYLLWNRLKWTIDTVLKDGENLFSSGLYHGFFDQPHLSRAFKEMMGISPSAVYNSRTLQ